MKFLAPAVPDVPGVPGVPPAPELLDVLDGCDVLSLEHATALAMHAVKRASTTTLDAERPGAPIRAIGAEHTRSEALTE